MKLCIKIISLLVSLLFATNTVSYALGTMPVTEKPQIIKEWNAAGRKLFAARWEECPVNFDTYFKPLEFQGKKPATPAGISEIKNARN